MKKTVIIYEIQWQISINFISTRKERQRYLKSIPRKVVCKFEVCLSLQITTTSNTTLYVPFS